MEGPQDLISLLADIFTNEEARSLLLAHPDTRSNVRQLPSCEVSRSRYMTELVGLLDREGKLSDELIQRLAEERPNHAGALDAAWRAWKQVDTGPDVETTGGPGEPDLNPVMEGLSEPVHKALSPFGLLHRDQLTGILAAIIALLGARGTRLLAKWAGVDAMSVDVKTALGPNTVPFGYDVEVVHGPFFTWGVPALILWAYVVIHLMSYAVWAMQRRDQLIVTGRGGLNAAELVRRRHQAFGEAINPALAVASALIVCGLAYSARDARWLGWGQAEAFALLRAGEIDLCDRSVWAPPEGCAQGWEYARVVHAEVPDLTAPPMRYRHLLFLGAELSLQTYVVFHLLWLYSKFVFFFATVHHAVGRAAEEHEPRLKIRLDFRDPKRRFGLQELDWVHTSAILTALLVSCSWALQTYSNRAKGTAYSQLHDPRLGAQVGMWALGVLGIAALALLPLLVQRFRLRTMQRDHLERLKRRGISPTSLKYRLADAQIPWPITPRWLVVVLMLVLSMFAVTGWLGSGGGTLLRLFDWLT